jgi:hypothetical protein
MAERAWGRNAAGLLPANQDLNHSHDQFLRRLSPPLHTQIARWPAVADSRCGRLAASCPPPRSSLMALSQHLPCGLLLLIACSRLLQTCRHSLPWLLALASREAPVALPVASPRLLHPLVASPPPTTFNPAYFVKAMFVGILQSRPPKLRLERLGGCAYICSC